MPVDIVVLLAVIGSLLSSLPVVRKIITGLLGQVRDEHTETSVSEQELSPRLRLLQEQLELSRQLKLLQQEQQEQLEETSRRLEQLQAEQEYLSDQSKQVQADTTSTEDALRQ